MSRAHQPSGLAGSTTAAVRTGPLAGVRVLELGSIIAGPFATRMLGDFGAEVIKIELPGSGDPLREWGVHRHEGRALWWSVQSRNKKLITLDVRQPAGRELCLRLLDECDVLVENFRPGTLEKWGLGPDQLHDRNPKLIIARISGYGQTGPYANRPGFASAGEAVGGLRYINGFPRQAAPRAGISLGDSLAAMSAAQGILMALYHRDANGGCGQVIDTAITESCFALLESMVPDYGKLGVVREPSGTVLPHVAPSNVYRTRDGKWVVIAANGENLWRRLCHTIGRADLLADERFRTLGGRVEHMAELDAIISEWTAQHDAAEIDRILVAADVVYGPVNSIADIFQDPQFRDRDMLIEVDDPEVGPLTVPGVVPKLSATPGDPGPTGAWELGAHNDEVYRELLGLDDDQLAALAAAGTI
ncbi:CaiB/BaiF CoA transferase family protein [Pseudonocardia bannensis]|uniref:CoA transferase n=1 Tax=Pseudonocardia bannensis TaxID=630973 RepID=A0A848DHN9_9PSEU|nr:CoA transferase [Pseudonocardia bannensis]NMH92021.1 CoA transferase [Pseudonocardia bannensis]